MSRHKTNSIKTLENFEAHERTIKQRRDALREEEIAISNPLIEDSLVKKTYFEEDSFDKEYEELMQIISTDNSSATNSGDILEIFKIDLEKEKQKKLMELKNEDQELYENLRLSLENKRRQNLEAINKKETITILPPEISSIEDRVPERIKRNELLEKSPERIKKKPEAKNMKPISTSLLQEKNPEININK